MTAPPPSPILVPLIIAQSGSSNLCLVLAYSTLYILIPVMVMTTYQVGATIIHMLTDEEAEAQRGEGVYPRSHNNQ